MSLSEFETEAFEVAAFVVGALFVALFFLPVEAPGWLLDDGLMLGKPVLTVDDAASVLDHG